MHLNFHIPTCLRIVFEWQSCFFPFIPAFSRNCPDYFPHTSGSSSFKDCSVFYSTFPIREQARRGEWDYELKAVYVVGILNFSFDPSDPEYFHHEVKLVDLYTKKVFYDKLTFVFLEMPKFNKTEDELETMFDKWLFVLRNLSSLLERPKALQNRVFDRLFETAEKKGREEEKKENARNLKKLGVAIDIISQATGLTQDEVEQIQI